MNEIAKMVVEQAKALERRYDELGELIEAPEIIADNLLWRRLVEEHKKVFTIADLSKKLKELIAMYEKNKEELIAIDDKMLESLLIEENENLLDRINDIVNKILRFFVGEDAEDNIDNITLELKAREGGRLACKFCGELLKLYDSFATRKGLFVKKQIYFNNDDYVKYAVLELNGTNAYNLFKNESGAHRVLSDKNMASVLVTVLPKNTQRVITVEDKDIKIEVFHSGGAGGQNVNKVETAARAVHIPTGISAVCQDERSQLRNKQKAVKNLKTKVFEYYKKENNESKNEKQNIARVRTYDYNKGKVFDHNTGLIQDLMNVLEGQIDNFVDTLILKEKNNISN